MDFVDSYDDLEVYKRSRELAQRIFQITQKFPDEEQYSLSDQVRRSSRSVGAQIAECWGHRRYIKSFKSKLTDAYGEINETIHWLETARDCKYVDQKVVSELEKECHEIQRMINSMIQKADEFCDSLG